MATPQFQEDIGNAVVAFLKAKTWAETKQIVEAYHNELLSDAAEQVFVTWLKAYSSNDGAVRQIEMYRELLASCRHQGIEAAFADRLHPTQTPDSMPSQQSLLEEIKSLTRQQDIPRRIEACRVLLASVSRDQQSELWAALQNDLGNCFAQHPQGDRADNLERAIEHYHRAFQIYTQAAIPGRHLNY